MSQPTTYAELLGIHPAHLREGPVDYDRWLCEDSEHGWYLLKHDPRTPSELRREVSESPSAQSLRECAYGSGGTERGER